MPGAEAQTAHVQQTTELPGPGQPEDEPYWLTVAEYASRYRLNPDHLYRLLNSGQIDGAKQIGKSWRIPDGTPATTTEGTR